MSIKVGDKFVIEIGTIAELPDGKKKYFIKPFESLVFDKTGLAQLEPVEKAWENELEKAKLFAYKNGFEHGKKQAINELPELANKENEIYNDGYKNGYEDGKVDATDTDMIGELKQVEYIRGYNTAINDYNMMIQWLHDCKDDFKEFMNKKYGYDVMYLTNPKVDEGVMLYDLICDHDIAEVISEFQKWQEEKKKAEEESIKVGDIIYSQMTDSKAIIISFDVWDNWNCIDTCGTGFVIDKSKKEFFKWKKIGHTDEVEQLLDKLRGEKDEKN